MKSSKKSNKRKLETLTIKKIVLATIWAALIILTLTLPIYDTMIQLRKYDPVHFATAEGRNFFTIFTEGYETAFLYDDKVFIYLIPILLLAVVTLIIYLPKFFRSLEGTKERIEDADDSQKALERYGKARLPWLTGAILLVALSSPELACLIIRLQVGKNYVFLSNYGATPFVTSLFVRLALLIAMVVLSIISNVIVIQPQYKKIKKSMKKAK